METRIPLDLKILHIPEDYVVVAVTPIGYPAREGSRSAKKPMEQIVSYNGF